ncbi:MAG TPA: hypothetical protein PK765_03445 [bacterium]|nr:hypothetical protein [bacterium]
MPGISRMGDFVFREDVIHARRFIPSDRMEGFFVAKIVKAGE